MKSNILDKKFVTYCILISLICLSVCVIRVFLMTLTYDEAWTYLKYVSNNPFAVFSFLYKGTYANNHILNSFLISVLQFFIRIRYNEILIRIPNLLFYPIYLIYSYKIVKKYKGKYMYFAILTLNYAINEYFSLARGYGMCVTLVLIGVYYLKKYFDDKEEKDIIIGFGFLTLSCYANTIALLIVAAYFIVVIIELLKANKFVCFIKKYIIVLVIYLIFLLIATRYHFIATTYGVYGGRYKFFYDVVGSLVYYYGFNKEQYIIGSFILGVILTATILNIKVIKKPLYYVLPIYFAIMILLVKLNGVYWPTGRVLLPTFVICAIGLFELIESCKINQKTFIILNIVTVLGLINLFVSNIDFTRIRDFPESYIIKGLAYKAYKNKNKNYIYGVKDEMGAKFYRKKILKEKGYDIFK